jgi:eukaryotic-like serine/threonine-protein kinase
LTADDAIATLQAAGYRATLRQVDSEEAKGTVIAQAPAGGATAELGIAVLLDVSTGVTPTTEIPRVIRLTSAEARSTLEDAGFVVRVVTRPVVDPKDDGIVLHQDPAAGTPAEEGATVTITVGSK